VRTSVLMGLARSYESALDFDKAEQRYREALTVAQAAKPPSGVDIASAHQELGDMLSSRQQFAEADSHLRQAVEIFRGAVGPENPYTSDAERNLAVELTQSGHLVEAEALLQTVLTVEQKTRGADDALLVGETRLDLAEAALVRGRLALSSALASRDVEVYSAVQEQYKIGTSEGLLARALITQGKPALAAEALSKALPLIAAGRGEKSPSYLSLRITQGDLDLATGKPTEAAAIYREVIAASKLEQGLLKAINVRPVVGLAAAQRALGHPDEAVNTARDLLTRLLQLPQAAQLVDEEAGLRLQLGAALRESGRAAEAEPELRRALDLRTQLDVPESPWLVEARSEWARCEHDLGRHI
jgi:tetratricopeptide (TPR) repeat protein